MRDGIRLAVQDDTAAIRRVLKEAFSPHRSLYSRAAYSVTVPGRAEIRRRLQEGPIWVAIRFGEVVGTTSAVLRENEVYVRGMGVIPRVQGRGVAWELLHHVEALAKEERKKRLVLSTTPFLTRAIHLYERFGFRATDEGPLSLHGTPLRTMEKRLVAGEVKPRDSAAATAENSWKDLLQCREAPPNPRDI